jgi:DNA-binding transcriptional ArsR family regulator
MMHFNNPKGHLLPHLSTDNDMNQPSDLSTPCDSIKQEIQSLREELRRFIERTNQIHVNSIIADLKDEYAGLLSHHHVEQASDCLSHAMVRDCGMHDTCFQVFLDFLTTTSKHIKDGDITEEIVASYENQIRELRKKGPSDRCDICFTEVYRLFGKQVDLMRSLGILNRKENACEINDFPEDEIVTQIIEPLSSITRFQILKAVSTETKTFSDLSQLTKLRGGNLLFHLKKLQEAGMIIQRHERGDYIITEKGFRILNSIFDIYAHVTTQSA